MDREEAVNRKFATVYRGLDEKEVRDHLKRLQEEVESRDAKIRQLEGLLEDREENLNSFRNVETSINEAILTAQRAGDETKRVAKDRADEIVTGAGAERERIIEDALARARHIASQTEDMKRQSKIFRARFKMLVEAQLDLLKSEDWDYLLDFEQNQEHRVDDLEDRESKSNE
ncbi:DivIVA domain-containing protein [Salinicoccus halodurans]|uniref:Cell division initiation protein n=1 Tax=Salinicoccus halodurans TaxID=407035 RepID=A0A0F7HLJ5_9STAP|nr:DivIVA domain-containing protein [Salinicoccus halodurans]AKG73713.1 septum formation initiator [Salinicoccus halodurans]SFK54693.1 cell division initiation protein [Salinicoccus halodurans]